MLVFLVGLIFGRDRFPAGRKFCRDVSAASVSLRRGRCENRAAERERDKMFEYERIKSRLAVGY